MERKGICYGKRKRMRQREKEKREGERKKSKHTVVIQVHERRISKCTFYFKTAQKNLPVPLADKPSPIHYSQAELARVKDRSLNSNLSILFLVRKSDKNLRL